MNNLAPTATAATTQAAIRTESLVHRYGSRTALAGLTLQVEREEIFGFLGPNGGGKSTLFRILSTMMPPSEGRVELLGLDALTGRSEVRKRLGVVFQAPSLDKILTVRENLMHQGHLYGLRGSDLRRRIEDRAERLGVADRMKDRSGTLSGGLRRRVEIAKALLHDPELLLLDEPTTGLDPAARIDVWNHLRRLARESAVTIAFTTHLMEEAEGCDRLAILDAGSLAACDTPSALKALVAGDVVTIDAGDVETTAAGIESRIGVKTRITGGSIRIETPDGAETASAILKTFAADVRSVRVAKPGLEDVFVHLTGHRLAESGTSELSP